MTTYVLKKRDEAIALINLTPEGVILNYRLLPETEALAPVHQDKSSDWLKKWWSRRAVPVSQGHIRMMLEQKGLAGPEDYLVRNLGLSLTDCYWIAPVDSRLRWRDVSLFANDFHDDINIAGESDENPEKIVPYTPNSSLQGNLEKCWTIRNGRRGMIKGNHGSLSAESFNEVIAGRLHELQGFRNYTPYKLIEIHGRPYSYGCFSEIFTSEQRELVTAYDIVISQKQRPDINTYEHLLRVCASHGLEEDRLRPFLEYQIMTDFILSNRDRHLANTAVLRDADSLAFIGPAPIYDSGKSMFSDMSVPGNETDMLSIQTESFMSTELQLLSLVRDRSLVDVSKLPEASFIRDLYLMDENMDEHRIDEIIRGYEMKKDLFERWQQGEDLKKLTSGKYRRRKESLPKDLFV